MFGKKLNFIQKNNELSYKLVDKLKSQNLISANK